MDRVEKDDDANNNADEIDGAITDTQPNTQNDELKKQTNGESKVNEKFDEKEDGES